MFQFRRFPSYTYFIQYMIPFGGFPHSEISGSKLICSSPKLIAAYHVLHRLLMPRHSPCALCSLTYLVKIFQSFAFNITKNISWLTSQYVLKLYINSCAIFKEQFLEKHGFSKLNRLVKPVSSEYEVNILLLHFSIERRWSSRRFSYGYLVTTSPQSLTLP